VVALTMMQSVVAAGAGEPPDDQVRWMNARTSILDDGSRQPVHVGASVSNAGGAR